MFFRLLNYLNSKNFFPYYICTPLIYSIGNASEHIYTSAAHAKRVGKKILIFNPNSESSVSFLSFRFPIFHDENPDEDVAKITPSSSSNNTTTTPTNILRTTSCNSIGSHTRLCRETCVGNLEQGMLRDEKSERRFLATRSERTGVGGFRSISSLVSNQDFERNTSTL